MAKSISKPIMIYVGKDGRRCLLWPSDYKRGDKIQILEHLKEMARLVEEEKLKKTIGSFEQWKQDPGFEV